MVIFVFSAEQKEPISIEFMLHLRMLNIVVLSRNIIVTSTLRGNEVSFRTKIKIVFLNHIIFMIVGSQK